MTIAAMLLCSAPWACGQAGQSCGFAHDSDFSGSYTSSTDSDTCSGGGRGNTPELGENSLPAGFESLMNQNLVLVDYLNGARVLFSDEEPSALAVNVVQSDHLKQAANPFRQTSRKYSETLSIASRAGLADRPDLKNVTFLVLRSRMLGPIALRTSHSLPAYSLTSGYNREASPVADDAQKWQYA